ncbi:Myristoyl CoA protein N myristoyltransferase N terminal domain [Trypanosoma vivax]|uniref:Glycylpeptide N-tetradecanoyltransferase n=1 Tax=Trypanosoma vivax (strain Y486) TaxID=1055687 RepID=G0U4G4_TRYVY|nr:putative N-myristoyl transferase [Trypanosoma vivax]KAH8611331.1 Myristoyl CoA protein N myristoyltransferase N terminal domain [Trypanosoma vivax]CCC52328.1 putative N-myristoyl transferase, fragment [Trypanosoma vivax Y486]
MAKSVSNVHKFWNTQPVQQPGAPEADRAGPVEKPIPVEEVPTEPLPIASAFEWWNPDVQNEEDLNAIYELLCSNYVEDDDSMFRFHYSKEFLRWALAPPGYYPSWHVAVRRIEDKQLLGFVAGIPVTMRMGTPKKLLRNRQRVDDGASQATEDYLEPRTICEINFLCVHKTLRDKRMAPILIQEVTRRVHLKDIWQAIYTAGTLLPTPFASGNYFHRSLNPEKLIEVQFSGMPEQYRRFQNPKAMLKRLYRLPEETRTRGLRPMEPKDVPQVANLLREKLLGIDVAPVFTDEEVAYYILPRENVITSYVVERGSEGDLFEETEAPKGKKDKNKKAKNNSAKGEGKRITDFFSFYSLPSSVIGNSKHSTLKAAYIYYSVATSVPLTQLINDLLIVACRDGFDVCNVVDIYEHGTFLKDLKFLTGDGRLHYYFYNWSYPNVKPSDVGLMML